ncbi:MAG: 4-hydroxy-3-methylbut-2-enyl diphosphate reductase [Candidatus Eremiobacterota bacterium]
MKVVLAEAMGFCFGVRDALLAAEGLADPTRVTIYGELVHNEEVQARLTRRGFVSLAERVRVLPETPAVMITAHGVSQRELRHLERSGKAIVDTTCPLVRRAHRAAVGLRDQGYFVVILGKSGHVEVIGLTGDLERFAVVQREEDVETWPAERIGVMCQTTTAPDLVPGLLAAIERANPGREIRFVNTICKPTRDRQKAVSELLEQVQALVVVGGRNSNNTRALADKARERGVPCLHVQGPADLDPAWFVPFRQATVGLTAGTSTPDEVIRAVHQAVLDIAQQLERAA